MATKTSSNNTDKQLDNLIRKLDNWNNHFIGVISSRVSKREAEYASNRIYERRSDFINGLQHDHQKRDDFDIKILEKRNGCQLRIIGEQLLYEEYGTGIIGENSYNVNKFLYGKNLDDYLHNEGKVNPKSDVGLGYIKYDKGGVPYWTYFSDQKGDFTSTYGIEAGHFVFDTFIELSDGVAREIAKEEVASSAKKIFKL